MKVGDTVWIYDPNSRVYRDENGKKSTAPIFRGYFVKRMIVGETKISWLIGYSMDSPLKRATKIKKAHASDILYTSEEELDKRCWVEENRFRLSENVRECKNHTILRQIADLLMDNK